MTRRSIASKIAKTKNTRAFNDIYTYIYIYLGAVGLGRVEVLHAMMHQTAIGEHDGRRQSRRVVIQTARVALGQKQTETNYGSSMGKTKHRWMGNVMSDENHS